MPLLFAFIVITNFSGDISENTIPSDNDRLLMDIHIEANCDKYVSWTFRATARLW